MLVLSPIHVCMCVCSVVCGSVLSPGRVADAAAAVRVVVCVCVLHTHITALEIPFPTNCVLARLSVFL